MGLFGHKATVGHHIECFGYWEPGWLDPATRAQGRKWAVIWSGRGRKPKAFFADSLSSAVNRASREPATIYSDDPIGAMDAEVVFAIWPRPDDAGWKLGDVVVDVTRGAGEFNAQAIARSDLHFQAATLEDVATSALPPYPG